MTQTDAPREAELVTMLPAESVGNLPVRPTRDANMASRGGCKFFPGSRAGAIMIALALSSVAPMIYASSAPRFATNNGIRHVNDFIVVRILASSSLTEIDIFASDSDLLVTFNDEPSSLEVLSRGERMTVLAANDELQVYNTRFGRRANRISVKSSKGHVVSIGGQNHPVRTYRGELDFRVDPKSGGLTILNRVNIEEYVSSVVASEYGLKDVEGAKAMAVVARTYALRSRAQRYEALTYGAQGSPDYDLLDDTRAQVYRGDQSVTDQSLRAAFETAGETLLFEGALIQAVYSSSNGGKTAANESIWRGDPVPYLRGKDDPFDSISPHSDWRVDIDRKKLHEALSDRYGLRVESLSFETHDVDGRIREVTLSGRNGSEKTISGGAFRRIASENTTQLKSTFFAVEEHGNKYRFMGHGFGHGVGLSQWGAHGMALSGSSYGDILSFYYPGTNLAEQPRGQPDLLADQRQAIAEANAGAGSAAFGAGEGAREGGVADAAQNAGGAQSADLRQIQLGWGGGWIDLHAASVSGTVSALTLEQQSAATGNSRRRRAGW